MKDYVKKMNDGVSQTVLNFMSGNSFLTGPSLGQLGMDGFFIPLGFRDIPGFKLNESTAQNVRVEQQ